MKTLKKYLKSHLTLLKTTIQNKTLLKIAVYEALLGILSFLLWKQYKVVETNKLAELASISVENIGEKTKDELLQISGTSGQFIDAMFIIVPTFLIIQFVLIAIEKTIVYQTITKKKSLKIALFTPIYLSVLAIIMFSLIFAGNPESLVLGASLILLLFLHIIHIIWYELASTNKWSSLLIALKKSIKIKHFILPYLVIILINTLLNKLSPLTINLGKIPAQIISSVLLFMFIAFVQLYLANTVKSVKSG
ncbi:MAG: hypothetical protein O2779_03980 [Nanoarchaeota archaeon]|nr:hypothetical protein [Nanoarchaeota archaeon]